MAPRDRDAFMILSDFATLDSTITEDDFDPKVVDYLVSHTAMRDAVWSGGGAGGDQLVAINARHQRCFQRAAEAMEDAEDAFDRDEAPEIIAFELREALQAVGEVTGRVDVEEILDSVFGQFCIGK